MSRSKSEQAHSILERMIIRNELDPSVMYSEKQLTRLIGLGRTPVREALMRFADHNMAVIHPRRGVRFPAVNLEKQLYILEVRRGVEPLCAITAARRATAAQRQRMSGLAQEFRDMATTGNRARALDTLRETHYLIPKSTENPFFAKVIAPLMGPSRRFWFLHRNEYDNAAACAIHADLLQSIAAGEPEEAAAASNRLLDFLVDFSMRSVQQFSGASGIQVEEAEPYTEDAAYYGA